MDGGSESGSGAGLQNIGLLTTTQSDDQVEQVPSLADIFTEAFIDDPSSGHHNVDITAGLQGGQVVHPLPLGVVIPDIQHVLDINNLHTIDIISSPKENIKRPSVVTKEYHAVTGPDLDVVFEDSVTHPLFNIDLIPAIQGADQKNKLRDVILGKQYKIPCAAGCIKVNDTRIKIAQQLFESTLQFVVSLDADHQMDMDLDIYELLWTFHIGDNDMLSVRLWPPSDLLLPGKELHIKNSVTGSKVAKNAMLKLYPRVKSNSQDEKIFEVDLADMEHLSILEKIKTLSDGLYCLQVDAVGFHSYTKNIILLSSQRFPWLTPPESDTIMLCPSDLRPHDIRVNLTWGQR